MSDSPTGFCRLSRLLEQAQQCLRRLVGERQSLRAQLLPDLQGLQLRRLLRQIRVHQRADTSVQGIDFVTVVADLVAYVVLRRTDRVQFGIRPR